MIYKVIKRLKYKGEEYLPGSLINLSIEDYDKYASRVVKLEKHIKVIHNYKTK